MTIPLEETKSALLAAITNENYPVVALVGNWGVGKTYLWDKIRKENIERLAQVRPKYAYVSLFGARNAADIKVSIFAAIEDINPSPPNSALAKPISPGSSLFSRISQSKLAQFIAGRKGQIDTASTAMGAKGKIVAGVVGTIIDVLQFRTVRNILICLDDFERVNSTLGPSEVLAIVNELATERKCKVLLLMSTESGMSAEAKKELGVYREKVIDKEIALDPEIDYACQAAIPDANIRQLLRPHILALGLKNIRVIRKLRATIEEISDRTQISLNAETPTVFASASVLLYCHLVRQDKIPTVEDVMSIGYISALGGEQLPPDKAATVDFLRNLGWTHPDECDKLLAQIITRGSCDWSALKQAIEDHSTNVETGRKEEAFRNLWSEWRSQFRNSQQSAEFVQKIYATTNSAIDIVGAHQIQDVVHILRSMQENQIAEDLLDIWKAAHGNNPASLNLRDIEMFGRLRDEDFREYLIAQAGQLPVPQKDISEILSRMGEHESWGSGDIEFLASASTEDYVRAFRTTPNLLVVLRGWRQYVKSDPPDAFRRQIKETVSLALTQIGAESRSNQVFVEQLLSDIN